MGSWLSGNSPLPSFDFPQNISNGAKDWTDGKWPVKGCERKTLREILGAGQEINASLPLQSLKASYVFYLNLESLHVETLPWTMAWLVNLSLSLGWMGIGSSSLLLLTEQNKFPWLQEVFGEKMCYAPLCMCGASRSLNHTLSILTLVCILFILSSLHLK